MCNAQSVTRGQKLFAKSVCMFFLDTLAPYTANLSAYEAITSRQSSVIYNNYNK